MRTSNICLLSFYIFISKSYSQNKNVKITQYRFWLHFCKIKCLRRRTILIQTALRSPDPGECFTYPEHVPNSYQTFSRGLWKKFQLKIWGFVRIFSSRIGFGYMNHVPVIYAIYDTQYQFCDLRASFWAMTLTDGAERIYFIQYFWW